MRTTTGTQLRASSMEKGKIGTSKRLSPSLACQHNRLTGRDDHSHPRTRKTRLGPPPRAAFFPGSLDPLGK